MLQGVDWVTGRPRIIVAEVASLTRNRRDEIVEFLAEKGYSYRRESRHNAFFADATTGVSRASSVAMR